MKPDLFDEEIYQSVSEIANLNYFNVLNVRQQLKNG